MPCGPGVVLPVQRPHRHISLASLLGSFLLVVGLLAATPADANSGHEQRFIQLINQTRAGAGLAPLTANGELTGQARSWANSMASSDNLAHASDISRGISAPWTVLGENVGVHGIQDVDQLYAAFVASPGHYANIIDPRYTHVGVGVVVTDAGKLWTTHRFMAVATAPSTTSPPTTAAPTTTPTTTPPTTVPSSTRPPSTTTPSTAPPTTTAPATSRPPTPSTNALSSFEPTEPPPEAWADTGRAATTSTPTTTTTTTTTAPTTVAAGQGWSSGPASTSAIADAEPDEQAPAPIVPDEIGGWPGGTTGGQVEPIVAGPTSTDVDAVEQMLLDLIEAGI